MIKHFNPVLTGIADDVSLLVRNVSVNQVRQEDFRHAARILKLGDYRAATHTVAERFVRSDTAQFFPALKAPGG